MEKSITKLNKKTKVLLIALLIFVLTAPIFALFGCTESIPLTVSAYSSYFEYGTVEGMGTYKSGDLVTLTARAKNNQSFLAWVYEGETLLENNDIYTINNHVDQESQKTLSSTLTFTLTAKSQGSYTAIFSDPKMMYVKFNGVMLSTSQDANAVEEFVSSNVQIFPATSFNLSQGTNQTQVFSADELQFKQLVDDENHQTSALVIRPEKVSNVLRLNTTKQISAQLSLVNLNFRADISYKKSDTDWTVGISGVPYRTRYDQEAKEYKIIFNFQTLLQAETGQESITLYLTLFYKEL